jgi:hypothetical protein
VGVDILNIIYPHFEILSKRVRWTIIKTGILVNYESEKLCVLKLVNDES